MYVLSFLVVLVLFVVGITDSYHVISTSYRLRSTALLNMKKSQEGSGESVGILRQAAATKAVDRQEVITSIRQLESKSPKIDAKSVEGKWELIFSSIPGGAAEGYLVGGFFNGYFANKVQP